MRLHAYTLRTGDCSVGHAYSQLHHNMCLGIAEFKSVATLRSGHDTDSTIRYLLKNLTSRLSKTITSSIKANERRSMTDNVDLDIYIYNVDKAVQSQSIMIS